MGITLIINKKRFIFDLNDKYAKILPNANKAISDLKPLHTLTTSKE